MTGDEGYDRIDNRLCFHIGFDLLLVVSLGVGHAFLHLGLGSLIAFRLDQQVTLHFQMERRAELGAVVRIDTGLIGNELGRHGLARLNGEVHIGVADRETMGFILGTLQVGQMDDNLITLFNLDDLRCDMRTNHRTKYLNLARLSDRLLTTGTSLVG